MPGPGIWIQSYDECHMTGICQTYTMFKLSGVSKWLENGNLVVYGQGPLLVWRLLYVEVLVLTCTYCLIHWQVWKLHDCTYQYIAARTGIGNSQFTWYIPGIYQVHTRYMTNSLIYTRSREQHAMYLVYTWYITYWHIPYIYQDLVWHILHILGIYQGYLVYIRIFLPSFDVLLNCNSESSTHWLRLSRVFSYSHQDFLAHRPWRILQNC